MTTQLKTRLGWAAVVLVDTQRGVCRYRVEEHVNRRCEEMVRHLVRELHDVADVTIIDTMIIVETHSRTESEITAAAEHFMRAFATRLDELAEDAFSWITEIIPPAMAESSGSGIFRNGE